MVIHRSTMNASNIGINANQRSSKKIEFAHQIRQWFHNPEYHQLLSVGRIQSDSIASSIGFIHLDIGIDSGKY